jgi:hypothetical protein
MHSGRGDPDTCRSGRVSIRAVMQAGMGLPGDSLQSAYGPAAASSIGILSAAAGDSRRELFFAAIAETAANGGVVRDCFLRRDAGDRRLS